MLSKKINRFFLAIFLVTSLACTANATILGYSYNVSDISILFTIDDTQGYSFEESGNSYSMHNAYYDTCFTISLAVGGTTYSNDVFSWTDGYPLVTLNFDLSINAIDYWASAGDKVIVIETSSSGITLTSVAYSDLDTDNDDTIDKEDLDNDNDEKIDDDISAIIAQEGDLIGTINSGTGWTTSEIPEPATFALFGFGLLGLAWFDRRKALK